MNGVSISSRYKKRNLHGQAGEKRLTSVDGLWRLLLDLACAVLGRRLGVDAGLGAVRVEVAAVVHGLLERVALPPEHVVSVGGGASVQGKTATLVYRQDKSLLGKRGHSPEVHAVDKRLAAVRGPGALVREHAHVPHELVHDLRQLDGVRRRALGGAAGRARRAAVVDVALVVGAVEVLAVPAAVDC